MAAAPSCCSTRSSAPVTPATTCCSSPITSATATRSVSLTIDPTTGASQSGPHGVARSVLAARQSAATLHSSGESSPCTPTADVFSARAPGRHPAATRSPLGAPARYRDRRSSRSPTAVAVTNPGIVIVLEAGAAQLAAYDLAGNPVRYFGGRSPCCLHAGLVHRLDATSTSPSTAQANIYVLSYDNDGANHPLPRRRLRTHRHPHCHQQPWRQRPACRCRLLAQHLRRQLHCAARRQHRPAPHRPRPRVASRR